MPASSFVVFSAWPLFALVACVALAQVWFSRRRMRQRAEWLGPRYGRLASENSQREQRGRDVVAVVALGAGVVAMMQPLVGIEPRFVRERGADLVVCLDVSRSMLATDVEPSRLARAQRDVIELVERSRGDRFALVLFAGSAKKAVPLTSDSRAFAQLVEFADPTSVPLGGSDLGAAIDRGLELLAESSGDHSAILLLTDGEELTGTARAAAIRCRDAEIPLHAVGYGSERGSKIPVLGDGEHRFLTDRGGSEVVTLLREDLLRTLCDSAGGEAVGVGSETSANGLIDLYERRVLPSVRRSFEAREGEERKNRFQWPLIVAILLWMVELSLTGRNRR